MTGAQRRGRLMMILSVLGVVHDSIVTTGLWKHGGSFREFTSHRREGRPEAGEGSDR